MNERSRERQTKAKAAIRNAVVFNQCEFATPASQKAKRRRTDSGKLFEMMR